MKSDLTARCVDHDYDIHGCFLAWILYPQFFLWVVLDHPEFLFIYLFQQYLDRGAQFSEAGLNGALLNINLHTNNILQNTKFQITKGAAKKNRQRRCSPDPTKIMVETTKAANN